jgi:uncharacterized membrane protein
MALFIFIGICWVPVIVIQYKLKALADSALNTGVLDPRFKKMMRLWTALGVPAFISILILFWLMVYKPFPVV